MKKKVLTMILTAALVAALLPTAALASEALPEESVMEAVETEADEVEDVEGTEEEAILETMSAYSNTHEISDTSTNPSKTVTLYKGDTSTTTFTNKGTTSLTISLTIKSSGSGSGFAWESNELKNVTATFGSTTKDFQYYSSSTGVTFSAVTLKPSESVKLVMKNNVTKDGWTFTQAYSTTVTRMAINNVAVTGVKVPEVGKTVAQVTSGQTLVSGDSSKYTVKMYSDGWYNKTDSKTMNATDIFEAGKTYLAVIMATPVSPWGFAKDSNGSIDKSKVTAELNGNTASYYATTSTSYLFSYEFKTGSGSGTEVQNNSLVANSYKVNELGTTYADIWYWVPGSGGEYAKVTVSGGGDTFVYDYASSSEVEIKNLKPSTNYTIQIEPRKDTGSKTEVGKALQETFTTKDVPTVKPSVTKLSSSVVGIKVTVPTDLKYATGTFKVYAGSTKIKTIEFDGTKSSYYFKYKKSGASKKSYKVKTVVCDVSKTSSSKKPATNKKSWTINKNPSSITRYSSLTRFSKVYYSGGKMRVKGTIISSHIYKLTQYKIKVKVYVDGKLVGSKTVNEKGIKAMSTRSFNVPITKSVKDLRNSTVSVTYDMIKWY